jgi:hypothetical protein
MVVLYFEALDEAWKIASTKMDNQVHFGLFTSQRNPTSAKLKGLWPIRVCSRLSADQDPDKTSLASPMRRPMQPSRPQLTNSGMVDLVSMAAMADAVAIWEMSGTNIIESSILSPNPGPTWHV